jgi:hypothetical protein
MYTNILNINRIGNYSPKRNYGRSDYNPAESKPDDPKSKSAKLLNENASLNSTKPRINLVVDGKIQPSSAAAKMRKSFKSFLETAEKNPTSFSEFNSEESGTVKSSYAYIENSESNSDDMDYVIVINEDDKNSTNPERPLLKHQQRILDKYNTQPRWDPGRLVNVLA